MEKELENLQWLLEKEDSRKKKDDKPYIPFYGDITKLNTERTILDLVGKDTLEALCVDIMHLLDTSVAVYEKNGDYAFGMFMSSWCQIMDAASRKLCNTNNNKEALTCGKWLCHENCWNDSAKVALKTGKPSDIDCIGGINLYAEPIYAGTQIIGVINIGYGNPPTDEKTLKELSRKYRIDYNTLLARAKEYKHRSPFIIDNAKKRLHNIAFLIGKIVESAQNERKLRESEEKFKTITENSADAIFITDQKGNYVYVNQAVVELLGYSKDELINKNITDISLPEEIRSNVRDFQRLLQGEKVFKEFNLIRKDGSSVPTDLHAILLPNGFVYGSCRDITERKRTEKNLFERNKELDHLYSIAKIIEDSNISTDQALQSIVALLPSAWQYPEFVCAGIQVNGQNIKTKNFQETKWKQSVPIIVQNQPIGRLEVFYLKAIYQSEEDLFLKEEQDLINSFAKSISQYLERKKIEEKLEKSEEYNRSIIEVIPDIIFRISNQGIYLDVIASSEEMIYLSKEEVLGKNLRDTLPKKTAVRALSYINKAIKSKVIQLFEYELEVPAGNLWFEARILPSGEEEVFSLIRNITERKKMEQAIKKSQQEFASLFQSNPEATIYLDKKGYIQNINLRFSELFGYTLEEIKGKNIDIGLIQPPDKMKESKGLTRKAFKGDYISIETIRKKKDGTLFPVLLSASPLYIEGKYQGVIGIYTDISKRKEMEEKIEKLACIDSLTGCYNRRYGLELLHRQMKLSHRNKSPLLLAFLDIDNFKTINDTFGHNEGDKVLKEVVGLFSSSVREVDIICRMGGDEFLLVFPDSSLQEVRLIRDRLQKKLTQLKKDIDRDYTISLSMGFSEYLADKPQNSDDLISIADKRMYEEKKKKEKTAKGLFLKLSGEKSI